MNKKQIKEARLYRERLVEILSKEFDTKNIECEIDFMLNKAEQHIPIGTPEKMAYERGFNDGFKVRN